MESETLLDTNDDETTAGTADPIGTADIASSLASDLGNDINDVPLSLASDNTQSLNNQVELDEPLTLAINQASPIGTALSPEEALRKAKRIQSALGEDSPGFDSLVAQYLDPTGTQEMYNREMAAANEDVKIQQEKNAWVNEIVQAKGKLTQFDIDLIQGMSTEQFKKYKANPKLIFEEAYGKAYIDKVTIKEQEKLNSPLGRWMRNAPPQQVLDTMDIASSWIAKQEIIEDLHSRIKKQWEESGIISQTGDFLSNFIPLAEQLRQWNRFEGSQSYSLFKGQNIQDQVQFAFGLDNATFKERLTLALEALRSGNTRNLWLAWDYIDKFQIYSKSDQFVDTFWGLVDAASIVPLKATGKLVGKVGEKVGSRVAITTPTSSTIISGDSRGVQQAKESLQKTLVEVPTTPFQANKTNPTQDVVGANQNYWGVWHGTPHKFDKPDVGKINTGEKTQMEGWGLYATEEKGVADWYRKQLSGVSDDEKLEEFFNSYFGGYTFDELNQLNKNFPKGLKKSSLPELNDFRDAKEVYERIINKKQGINAHKETLEELKERLKYLEERIEDIYLVKDIGDNITEKEAQAVYNIQLNMHNLKKVLLYAQSLKKEPAKPQPGYVYNWGVKAKKEDFIDLEKKIDEMPSKHQDIVNQVIADLVNTDPRMEKLILGDSTKVGKHKTHSKDYFDLTEEPLKNIFDVMRSIFTAEETSELKQKFTEALKAKGIKGNTYIGESSSKRNYVFFDDSYLSVISRNGDPITAMSDTLKGYDPKDLNIKKALNGVGDTHGYAAASLAEQAAVPGKQFAAANDSLPGIVSPIANDINKGVMESPVAPLVNARAQEYYHIMRLTPEAWEEGVQRAIATLKEDMTDASSLMDVKLPDVPAFDIVTPRMDHRNVGYVLHNVGDINGQLFESVATADYHAKNWYRFRDEGGIDMLSGLKNGRYEIKQHGNGFYIQLKRYVDETHESVREKLPTGLNERNPQWWDNVKLVNMIFGNRMALPKWLNIGARKADHMTQLINQYFDDERKILGALNKKEQKKFSQFLSDNQFKPNPEGGVGTAYDTDIDFSVNWYQMFNEMPSVKIEDAYFKGYRSMMDKEHTLRNDARLRDRARHGLEEWTLKTAIKNDQDQFIFVNFGGKRIDQLPKDTTLGDTGVFVYNDAGSQEYLRLSKMTVSDHDRLAKLVNEKGYKIVQIENHHQKPFKALVGEDVVSYFVSKNATSKPLSDKQIRYNPGGGHIVYTDPYSVVQGQITRIDDYKLDGTSYVRHQYTGDRVVLSATTSNEMNKFAKKMDQVRQLMNSGNDGALQSFLTNNLPFTLSKWKSMFENVVDETTGKVIEKAKWDKHVPFVGRDYGRLSIEQRPDVYKQFQNLENLYENKHSIMTDIENKFVSDRDERVWRIIEKGVEGNPDYRTQLGYANVLDPLAAMNKGIQAAVKSQYFKDFQLSSLETFASTYLPFMKKEVRDLFYTDMSKFITKDDIWDVGVVNKEIINAGRNMQRAINNLISMQTPDELTVGLFRQKFGNWMYDKYGQKPADYISDFKLATMLDPKVFIPTAVYHAKIGMFNPSQLWTQLQAFTNITAIGWKDAMSIYPALIPARYALFNSNMTEHMGEIASKMSGLTKDQFVEAMTLMKAHGFHKVEGDHTWVHEIFSNTNPHTKWGKFKEWSQFFFKEGERATRLASWLASYKEYTRLNPGKVIDAHAAEMILDRAGVMAGNMTKHANASWQRGWTNIPTQFWSVQGRLAELMLGHETSGWEKTRIALFNSFMYGVPAGVLGTAVGVYPWTETVKRQALEAGVDLDDPKIKAFMDGIPSAIMQLMTGRDYDFTGKYGPQGIPFLRDLLFDGEFMKALGGVGGSLMSDLWKSSMPVQHYLWSNLTFQNTGPDAMPPPDLIDFADALRNISSVNNGVKAIMAITMGKLVSKNEIFIAEADTVDGIMAGIFGLTSRRVSDLTLMARSLKYDKEAKQVAEEQITKYYRRAVEAYAEGNRENGDRHLQMARAYVKLGDFRVQDTTRIFANARKGWESYEQRIKGDFFLNKVPQSKVEQRRQMYINKGQ